MGNSTYLQEMLAKYHLRPFSENTISATYQAQRNVFEATRAQVITFKLQGLMGANVQTLWENGKNTLKLSKDELSNHSKASIYYYFFT